MNLQITLLNAFLIMIILPGVIAIILVMIINSQTRYYEERISFFEAGAKNFVPTQENYDFLIADYLDILNNNYNQHRTEKAYKIFQQRFDKIIKEKLSQIEYNCRYEQR
jgi:hypothetical protein